MIWQNPWAWAGLAAIALPVLIHLLGRGHARVQRFPTLRFLSTSRLLPTRRTRVHDLLLLAIRAGILVAAVAALAQPYLMTARRRRALDAALARAIVLDTSASMRATLTVARTRAKSLADSAQESVILETRDPSRAIAGAAAWLGTTGTRGELVVVSDFQGGTLNDADLAAVPARVGVRLVRVANGLSGSVVEQRTGGIVSHATLSADRTEVEWNRDTSGVAAPPKLLAGAAEQAGVNAALRAALTVTSAREDSTHSFAVVYPHYEHRAELIRSATPLRSPWMADAVARIAADSLLAAATREASIVVADSAPGVVVARTAGRRPAVVAAQDRDQLLLFALADASSLTSASLIAAALRATSPAPDAAELDPAAISDATLASWQRAPASTAPAGGNAGSPSDGRWLWVLAIVLLIVESIVRRETSAAVVASEPRSTERAHAA